MCGITGIFAFTPEGKKYLDTIDDAVKSLHHRGPDGSGVFRHGNVALGHTRLAIIDTSDAAAQPFTSSDGRYTIVFNGEIFNYRELRADLEKAGCTFRSQSDTEVLLTLFSREGKSCLDKLNGFFAFAVYDQQNGSLFIARDRYGEKPLYIATTSIRYARNPSSDTRVNWLDGFMGAPPDAIAFASEPKAFYAMGFPVSYNSDELQAYLHLNYLPAEATFNSCIDKVRAGSLITYHGSGQNYRDLQNPFWYTIGKQLKTGKHSVSYESACAEVRKKLELSVQRRLISDVPIGSFLSGGVDSSIVSALAAKQKAQLETFSIGYADEKYFDETEYAQMVSKHIGSRHHVFSLTNNDLLDSLHTYLKNLDEPFADSSALAVNILSRETKKHVTVALSGDGADELFAGYNKHAAEYLARNPGLRESFIRSGRLVWAMLPASRQNKFGNTIRQLRKFSNGMSLKPSERYWRWAGYSSGHDLNRLMIDGAADRTDFEEYSSLIHNESANDMNDVLRADFELVLEGDMLVKVDRMSMLNSLEVRSPFLDHELVEYVMSLPCEYKITRHERKRILKDAFRDMLPQEIFSRKKQGFEVPLIKWFRNDLRGMIDELLDEKFLKEQNLFHPEEVKTIRKKLHSNDPGDSAARIWGLIVFQSWWKKFGVK